MRAKEDETMATAADVDLEVQVSVDVTFAVQFRALGGAQEEIVRPARLSLALYVRSTYSSLMNNAASINASPAVLTSYYAELDA